MAMHSCVCTQLKLNLSLLLSQAAVAEDEIHEWCAGDFSQGLLPSTGAPGIVVPMVRICTSKQSLGQLCVMPLYNLHTLRCNMQMRVTLKPSDLLCWHVPSFNAGSTLYGAQHSTAQHSTHSQH